MQLSRVNAIYVSCFVGKKSYFSSEVSSKARYYFKFHRQDIILGISLHAYELSSQASILKVLTLQPEIATIKLKNKNWNFNE